MRFGTEKRLTFFFSLLCTGTLLGAMFGSAAGAASIAPPLLGAGLGALGGAISGVTLMNNNVNGLRVDGGSLPADGIWDDPEINYVIQDAVTVPAGKTLTVAAGQVIKFREFGNFGVTVNGTLKANGLPGSPVIFTTTRDDAAGNTDAYNRGNQMDRARGAFAASRSLARVGRACVRRAAGS